MCDEPVGRRWAAAVRVLTVLLVAALLAGLGGCGAAPVADPGPDPATAGADPTQGAIAEPAPADAAARSDAPGCAGEAAEFLEAATALLAEWEAAEAAADAQATEELGPAIDRLEAILARARELEPPECALDAKVALVRFMALTIDYQNGLWAQDCELCIEEQQVQARAAKQRVARLLGEVAAR